MKNLKRIGWLIGGGISLLIGFIGVVAPLVPTTPLIILAAFCFSKSSKTLHQWLIMNKYFGHYIQDYQKGKGVPFKIKVIAVVSVWLSMLVTLITIPLLFVRILMLFVASFVSIFIFTSPILKSKQEYEASSNK
ncbi:YbaN family protein [Gracilibacillus sp. S3-1-1]|uniref:YbaN family protein n=1 Tax=Gracilibacillus pellucidus TaxID=3095368 RepID=A0ACC6M1F7_9BACI|nr:YbaN family protein [Gracilibacillus sp. S3-1-1]MDX8044748.1 YbaN family protein [Gracilibacillus sp. S3-1-1]